MNDAELLLAVEERRAVALEICRFVHDHPELAHAEHACSTRLAEALAGAGFDVERGIAGMDTAFRATLTGALPGRSVGVVALYDAVAAVRPSHALEAVHSCGHGPIAGGVVGAGMALAGLRDSLPGRFVVVGCPADEIHSPGSAERGGGKALSAEAGVWDDLDAALYAHPEFIDTVSLRSRWMRRYRILVDGTRSLRGKPERPLEAAAALLEATRSLGPDAMLERLELDGDVEEGTGLLLQADVLLFADDEPGLARLGEPLRSALPGAHWQAGRVIQGVRPDAAVTRAVADAFRAAGRTYVPDPPPLPFATDFGNISRRVPAALIGIGHEGGWAFHTDEGAAQFASPEGDEAALVIAKVLALATARLLEPSAS